MRFRRTYHALAWLAMLLCVSCGRDDAPVPSTMCTVVASVPADTVASEFSPQMISFSPDSRRIVLSLREGGYTDPRDITKIFDTQAKQWTPPEVPPVAPEVLKSVHYSPTGRFLVVYTEAPKMQRFVRVYTASDLRERFAASTRGYGLAPIVFSPDEKHFLRPVPREGNRPFAYAVVEALTGIEAHRLSVDNGSIRRMGITADGRFAFGHQDQRVLIWNVQSGQQELVWEWSGTGAVCALRASSDSTTLRALMQEGTVATFDLKNPGKVTTTRLQVPPVDPKEARMIPFTRSWSFNHAAFTADCAEVMRDDTSSARINVYDVQTGALKRNLALPAGTGLVQFDLMIKDLVPVRQDRTGFAIIRLPQP